MPARVSRRPARTFCVLAIPFGRCDNPDVPPQPTGAAAMFETSASLLQRLHQQADEASWKRLVDLYTPLLQGWFRRERIPPSDVDDLVQDVLAVLVREL